MSYPAYDSTPLSPSMKQIALETPTHVHLLRCCDDVEVLDQDTIDVTAPDWLEGGRMPIEGRMIRDLILDDSGRGPVQPDARRHR